MGGAIVCGSSVGVISVSSSEASTCSAAIGSGSLRGGVSTGSAGSAVMLCSTTGAIGGVTATLGCTIGVAEVVAAGVVGAIASLWRVAVSGVCCDSRSRRRMTRSICWRSRNRSRRLPTAMAIAITLITRNTNEKQTISMRDAHITR